MWLWTWLQQRIGFIGVVERGDFGGAAAGIWRWNVGVATGVTAMAGIALAATLVISARRGSLKSPWSRRKRKRALTPQKWSTLLSAEGKIRDEAKFLKKIRSGGIDPSIRPAVWPLLLGVYELNSTEAERETIKSQNRKEYNKLRRRCLQLLNLDDDLSKEVTLDAEETSAITTSSEETLDKSETLEKTETLEEIAETLGKEAETPEKAGTLKKEAETLEKEAKTLETAESQEKAENLEEAESQEKAETLEEAESQEKAETLEEAESQEKAETLEEAESQEKAETLEEAESQEKAETLEEAESREKAETLEEVENQEKAETLEGKVETQEGDVEGLNETKILKGEETLEEEEQSGITGASSSSSEEEEGESLEKARRTTENYSTWQRIIRLDALRANAEWITYSPEQAAVSEAVAAQVAAAAGLRDYDHLEPCRVFHAARLVSVLEAYALYDPEIGYCQGMSDLLSPIIAVLEDDSEAFWCFAGFMRKARHNFRLDELGIRRQLSLIAKIIKHRDGQLYKHLQKLQAEDCFFVYRMVVVLLRREMNFEQTLCLWEVMWADQAAVRAGVGKSGWDRIRQRAPPTEDLLLYAIAACVLQRRKLIIEKYSSMDEILRECNSMAGRLDFWRLLDDAHDLVVALHDKV